MNIVVLGYGVDELILGTGAALVVVGLGLGVVGLVIYRLARKQGELAATAAK